MISFKERHLCSVKCTITSQKCYQCKIVLPLSGFFIKNRRYTKHYDLCKNCCKNRDIKLANKNKVVNQNHTCIISQCNLKTDSCATCKNVYPLHYFGISHNQKGGHHYRCLHCDYRTNAQKMQRTFDISPKFFFGLITRPCFICEQFNKNHIINTIDRINNDKGYEIDNLIAMCIECNFIKQRFTFADFLKHILSTIEPK